MKLITKILDYIQNFIQMFNNVNKRLILHDKFTNIRAVQYNLSNKNLLTFNT